MSAAFVIEPISTFAVCITGPLRPPTKFKAFKATQQGISRFIGIISKLNYFLLTSALFKLNYIFVHPNVRNESIVWGSTLQLNLKIFLLFKTKPLSSLKTDLLRPCYSLLVSSQSTKASGPILGITSF